MNFDLNDDQRMIENLVERFLSDADHETSRYNALRAT
jgi:hypothetical protein